jgi:hypothetical protein
MNKTEAHYAATVLEPALRERTILWYAFEPWKLRLGPKNFYTVDFGVVNAERQIQCHEVKAVWSTGKVGFKEDARQKVRDAAQMFPFYQFVIAAHRSKSAMRKAGTREEWLYEYLKSHTTRPPPA